MGHHAAGGGQALRGADAPADPAAVIEAGRRLFASQCNFVFGATSADNLPEASLPEIAFLGRSNVGKSSLINALTGRKSLARTSHTPGRTRQLNFFELGGRVLLVDMPGYGYAKASKRESAAWRKLIGAYFRGRPNLRRLFLLIDARHGFKANDRETMKLLDDAAVSFQIVLTKSDKTHKDAVAAISRDIDAELADHAAARPKPIVTSASSGEGIEILRASIAELAAGDQFG
ncbi:MAG TPA: ribosome biogenesis GTP-binding protein YihA/YsxC [Alphaproteobacteria bacterium]|nr:ribosome biogenesis GTP-binding protein YihA/YsxC [Alphaproteobacteria bacterium]